MDRPIGDIQGENDAWPVGAVDDAESAAKISKRNSRQKIFADPRQLACVKC
jgi:hypothetical protein